MSEVDGMLSSNEGAAMNAMYDSDTFIVVYYPIEQPKVRGRKVVVRDGFEIVNKIACKSVYLDGPWAKLFQAHVDAWNVEVPEQEEVEELLAGFCELAQIPLVMH